MYKDQLWNLYLKSNPTFARDDSIITLTGKGVQKLFNQTWDQAYELGLENGKALQKASMEAKSPDLPFKDLFQGIF